MNAFTPGPWVANLPSAVVVCANSESKYHTIASLNFSRDAEGRMDPEVEANCRLVAAAPDLLSALEVLLARPMTAHAEALADAAIKKARGDK